MMLFCAAYMAK